MKKISTVKSETIKAQKSEAIKNQLGKVLKEYSIIGRSWSSAKFLIVQNYTENANENVPLTIENVIHLIFCVKVCTCSFFVKDIFIL